MLQSGVNQPLLWMSNTDTERSLFHIYLLQMFDVGHAKTVTNKQQQALTSHMGSQDDPHEMSWQTAVEIQAPLYFAVVFNVLCLFLREIIRTRQTHMVAACKSRYGCNLHSLIPHTSG